MVFPAMVPQLRVARPSGSPDSAEHGLQALAEYALPGWRWAFF